MNPNLIETEDGEVLGIYVDGFVNKQLLIDTYSKETENTIAEGSDPHNLRKLTIEDVKYQWCKLDTDEKGVIYATLSDKEETGSFGVTAIYW